MDQRQWSSLALLAPDAVALETWGTVRAVGWSLFTDYVLSFEVAAILLTVGVIGVVVLGDWQVTAKRKRGA